MAALECTSTCSLTGRGAWATQASTFVEYPWTKDSIMASHIDWGAWLQTFVAIALVIVMLVVALLSVVERMLARDPDKVETSPRQEH